MIIIIIIINYKVDMLTLWLSGALDACLTLSVSLYLPV